MAGDTCSHARMVMKPAYVATKTVRSQVARPAAVATMFCSAIPTSKTCPLNCCRNSAVARNTLTESAKTTTVFGSASINSVSVSRNATRVLSMRIPLIYSPSAGC